MSLVRRVARPQVAVAYLAALLPVAAFRAPAFMPAAGLSSFQTSPLQPSTMRLRTGPQICRLSGAAASITDEVKSAISDNKVMVFSKTFCPFCVKAKKTLDSLSVDYEVMELDKRDDGPQIQDLMVDITGGRSVPRVFVGGDFIGGGDDVVAKSQSGELQELLKKVGAMP
mmetsp:Transcript_21713/g.34005  ORF Transcript_21713/g.34005 Transcript_21713/m.34005 type:complete len:170 (-) Transcript_21713:131-640(-)|eukprot:CAMPEP_0184310586 /NCGR_PEP_ID=MMETSP1049-20130417/31205_1 /TAXON_ID=77928 /ORGANISM="Proteomonas sulcata, Strain CCMP704" /LENGTH=169 /DNA_ID=CAMNT_0026624915 /DNA_START=64 /DNA_END=573 /DNA_ORIENTATION=+